MKKSIFYAVFFLLFACSDDDSGSGLVYDGANGQAVLSAANAVNVGKYTCASQENLNAIVAWGESVILLEPGMHNGSCNGSVTISESATSASLSFMNYCDATSFGEVNVNGSASGFLDNGNIVTEYSDLSIGLNNINITMNGTAKTQGNSFVLDMVVRDNATGKLYKQENFTISSTGVSGRLYFSDYGYVDVSTPGALSVNNGDIQSGEILFQAANDTSVSVSFTNGNYSVDLTEGGNTSNIDSGSVADFCL